MSCLLKLQQLLNTLSHSERKLALFLQSHPDKARDMSSQALAKAANVSQSSVVKFAQKLGYRGFTELRLALGEAVVLQQQQSHGVTLHHQIRSDDTLPIVGEKLIAESIRTLQATLQLNPELALDHAVNMLAGAKRILLCGIGSSALVAKDFSYKLLKIGMTALTETDPHVQLTIAQTLSPDDLLLAISFSGSRREVNGVVKEALKQGTPVLALTGYQPNALHPLATHCLYTVADEVAVRSSAMFSRTAQLAMTDLLFMGLVQRDVGNARHRILYSEELVKKLV
ncbi:MAG: MurR/RpiR family transcriptional regulator [Plesiomonas sp.]